MRSSLSHSHKHTRACRLSLSLAEHGRVLKGQLSRPSGSHISRGCRVDIIISGLVAVKAKVICNLPNYLLQEDKTNEHCDIVPSINVLVIFSSHFLFGRIIPHANREAVTQMCRGGQSFNYCLVQIALE